MKKATIVIIFIFSIYGVFTLVCGFIPSLGRYFLPSKDLACTPDLYQLSLVDDFKHPMPSCRKQITELDHPKSRYLIAGDCFFEETANGLNFMEIISERLSERAWNPFTFETGDVAILDVLRKNPPVAGAKTLILGFVERNIEGYVNSRRLFSPEHIEPKSVDHKGWDLVKFNLGFFDRRVDSTRFDFFFTHNHLFYPLIKMLKTLRYKVTGDLGSESLAPVFAESERIIFYGEDWEAYRMRFDDARVNKIADRVQSFSRVLKTEFGMDLVLFVFPNKLSIYGDLALRDFQYNGLIPRLSTSLNVRGIRTFDTYSALQTARATIRPYLPSDSHLSFEGKQFLLEKVLETIEGSQSTP